MDTIMKEDMLTHFLQAEDTKEKAMKVQEALERDPAVKAELEAASSFEELYEVFKRYLVMKFEDFKKLCARISDSFRQEKMALPDETMDAVVGGWSFWGFVEKYKTVIIATAIVVGCAVTAGALGAGLGALVGVCAAAEGIGTVAGFTTAGFLVAGGAGAVTGGLITNDIYNK